VPQAAGDQDPGAPNRPGAFNTPTLRAIANTAQYMHNGRLKTLREVVEFYNRESTVAPLELTEGEIDDLVEYLKSL
jgi:cytochrome c peroxidase